MKRLQRSIDIIEKARNYSLLAKNSIDSPIHVGSRRKLALILEKVKPDMIIATFGSAKRCIILVDYNLGELMDLIGYLYES